MKEGVDILYQPVIQDFNNGLYGAPDLLVRSVKTNVFLDIMIPEEKLKKDHLS